MPSRALKTWRIEAKAALDEIEGAHAAVEGTGRGRRYATHQINQAYAVLLASRFQKFCRDLHTEAADVLIDDIEPIFLKGVISRQFTWGRKLDRGNANPANIGSDFSRLGFDFWSAVQSHNRWNSRRKEHLEKLNAWRNAIAHQDFDPIRLGGHATVQLRHVQQWRKACDGLAASFDVVVASYLESLVGRRPWP